MFNKQDSKRNEYQLTGPLASRGYDWWWHSFTGRDAETGEERSFFIEFFLCNPALGGDKPVLSPVEKPSKRRRAAKKPSSAVPPSYLMVKAGSWGKEAAQLHKFYAWDKIDLNETAPFQIAAGDCYLSDEATCGSIRVNHEDSVSHLALMSDEGEMSWRLVMEKKIAFNVGPGAGRLMRRMNAFQMFWQVEGIKTTYKGQVRWNGRLFNVSPRNCFGYSDKNWGSDFTSEWLWLSSCDLKSRNTGKYLRNSAFDIGGCRPVLFGHSLGRKLLSGFWYEGRAFEFNFSKFWTFCRTRYSCSETKSTVVWHVEQRTLFNRMVVDVTCLKRDMVLMRYVSPDGERRHKRLWNGGTGAGKISLYRFGKLVDEISARHVGCEYGKYI